jgi:signal transduction histidine kinase
MDFSASHKTGVFHVPTLIFVVGLINLLQAFAFCIVGFYNRQLTGIRYWVAAALLNGLAMPLIVLRDTLDSVFLTKLLPTSMNFASAYLFYVGAMHFQKRGAARIWPLVAVLPLYIVYAWLIVHDEGLRYRPMLTSPIFILFLAMGARVLLTEKQPALQFGARFTAYAAFFICAIFAYRAVDLYFLATPVQLLDPVRPQVVSFTGGILWTLLWTFGTLMLINQRQTFENEQLHAEKLETVEKLAAAETELVKMRTQKHRQQLASDLHDGMGGITANLAMLAFQGSIAEQPQQQKEIFQNIEFLATEWNRELRLWMNGLERGSLLWADALMESHTYAQRLTTAHGIELDWHLCGLLPSEPDHRVQEIISLMRVLKEAIHNLARHSDARTAKIHVRFSPNLLRVVIKDDGNGINPANSRPGGRGLHNMQQRVDELGGTLKRGNVNGTAYCLRIPLPLQRRTNLSNSDDS